MRFLRKNCGDSRISYVKIADQNLERGFGTERWNRERHGEEKRRGRSAPGGASLPRFPFGDLILFFPCAFPPAFLLRSFPMTGSSCSAHPVSFPNVVQRQPLLCPWPFKTIYSVKIAGPKHEVCMDELICPESVQKQSPRTLSDPTMVTQRLAALRSHGSRFWIWGSD